MVKRRGVARQKSEVLQIFSAPEVLQMMLMMQMMKFVNCDLLFVIGVEIECKGTTLRKGSQEKSMQKSEKFAYMKNWLYLCTRLLNK